MNLQTDGFLDADLETALEVTCDLLFEVVELRSRLALLGEGTGEGVWAEAEDTVARALSPLSAS